MTIEVDFILPGVAATLLVLTLALHILRLTRQAQHCLANIPDSRPFRASAGMWLRRYRIDYASARLPLRDAAANQWHLRNESLVLREGEHEPPPMKSIEDRVAAAIAEALVVERSRVVAAASLRGDLNGDSLNQVEMIMILEEEFGIEISDEDAEMIGTVQQAIDYVLHALNVMPNPSQ